MIVIDASVWVSAVLPHDRFHTRSQAFIEQLLDGDVIQVVPTIFLPEVVEQSRAKQRRKLGHVSDHASLRSTFSSG